MSRNFKKKQKRFERVQREDEENPYAEFEVTKINPDDPVMKARADMFVRFEGSPSVHLWNFQETHYNPHPLEEGIIFSEDFDREHANDPIEAFEKDLPLELTNVYPKQINWQIELQNPLFEQFSFHKYFSNPTHLERPVIDRLTNHFMPLLQESQHQSNWDLEFIKLKLVTQTEENLQKEISQFKVITLVFGRNLLYIALVFLCLAESQKLINFFFLPPCK